MTILRIKPEDASVTDEISHVITTAFESAPHAGGNEAEIVESLRAREALTLSLVALYDNQIVGHIAASPVVITDSKSGWFGIAPLSVLPRHQSRGVGAALLREAERLLRQRGAFGAVLVGDPTYYNRHGFECRAGLSVSGIPQQYVLAKPFADEQPCGAIEFHQAFGL